MFYLDSDAVAPDKRWTSACFRKVMFLNQDRLLSYTYSITKKDHSGCLYLIRDKSVVSYCVTETSPLPEFGMGLRRREGVMRPHFRTFRRCLWHQTRARYASPRHVISMGWVSFQAGFISRLVKQKASRIHPLHNVSNTHWLCARGWSGYSGDVIRSLSPPG